MKTTFKKAALGSLVSVLSLTAMTTATTANAAAVPYQFAGTYEFSNCTDTNAYVLLNAGSYSGASIDTSNGDYILTVDGGAKVERITLPLSCDENGQLSFDGDWASSEAELDAVCNKLFPAKPELDVNVADVMCPAIKTSLGLMVNEAIDRTPQFVVDTHTATVDELVDGWAYHKYWLFGSYDGLVTGDNVTMEGDTYSRSTPVQSYGKVKYSRTNLVLKAIAGLQFGDDVLGCTYGYKDQSKQYYHSDYLTFDTEYRHLFECAAQVGDTTYGLRIEPIYQVDFRMDKTQ